MTRNNTTASAVSSVIVALGLAACSPHRQPAPTPQPQAEETTPAGAAAIEKARGVEATLQKEKEALDRTLQEQENPTAQ